MTQITVKINDDYVVDLLMKRLEYWNPDDVDRDLYHQMYDNMVECGAFHEIELDPMVIIDNDWVNYCTTVYADDEDYPQLLEAWQKLERDVSCDTFPSGSKYGYIEAYSPKYNAFLVRYR